MQELDVQLRNYLNEKYKLYEQGGDIVKGYVKYHNDDEQNVEYDFYNLNGEYESSPDSCVKCYTMFLPFLLIKIDVFS
ncbi:hypothetical protein DQU93_08825 [Staphylococcus aureus]|nr:hypothetical protein DQU93_08825 [Staphylococcus aureus]